VVLFIVALLYLVAWIILASPYNIMPSDDGYFATYGDANNTIFSLINSLSRSWHPIFYLYIVFCKFVYTIFLNPQSSRIWHFPVQTLLFSGIMANSVSIVLITIIIYRITNAASASLAGMILFATSAWPVNYYFFASYPPFSTMLFLGSLLFLIIAYERDVEKKTPYIILSGILLGLFFGASSSASVAIFLQLLLFIYLFPLKYNKRLVLFYFVAWGYTMFFFSASFYPAMTERLRWNLNNHYVEAWKQGIYVPKIPLFTFFRIAGTYNITLVAVFIILSVILCYNLIRSISINTIKNGKIIYGLCLFVWLHSIIIDLLPFTKLGRAHFTVYPLMIIAVVIIIHQLLVIQARKYRKPLAVLSLILLVTISYQQIMLAAKIRFKKNYAYSYLKSHVPSGKIYLLKEDPHAEYIGLWLRDFDIHNISISTLKDIAQRNKEEPMYVIIGPYGRGSGKSIIHHCLLDDFGYDDATLNIRNTKSITLPYFAYLPTFLLEELCMSFYFAGDIPDGENQSKNITLIIINGGFP